MPVSDGTERRTADVGGTLALYVHWPFCLAKCPYCDFNSHVREQVDHARWRAALLREMDNLAALHPGGKLGSIFFGGGTPSLMMPETAAAIIERARSLWPAVSEPEITLEANPGAADRIRFRDFAAAGINRLSLGVQSFDDDALRFLGRIHSAAEAEAAIAVAQESFGRVSFDLIYALPGQSVRDWEMQLERALAFATGHLSLYQLTIEPNTGFAGAVRRGAWRPLDGDTSADLYERTQEICTAAGLPAYEISNHARAGQESRHNLTYWRYGDYIGIGPGAHGRFRDCEGRRLATIMAAKPEAWLEQVEQRGDGRRETRIISAGQAAEEALMMGLRLSEGIGDELFVARTGRRIEDVVNTDVLDALTTMGLLIREEGRLRLLPEGRLVLNEILRRLLA